MKSFIRVFLGLVVLTLLSTGVAFLDLGWMNLPAALLIAGMQIAMIALFFMHIRRAKILVKLFAVGGLLWISILIALSFNDYISRGWIANPSIWQQG